MQLLKPEENGQRNEAQWQQLCLSVGHERRSDYWEKYEMKQLLLQNEWDFFLYVPLMRDGSGFGEQLCWLEPSCRLVKSERSEDRAKRQHITHWWMMKVSFHGHISLYQTIRQSCPSKCTHSSLQMRMCLNASLSFRAHSQNEGLQKSVN